MKKLIPVLALPALLMPVLVLAQFIPNTTSVNFENLTTSSTKIVIDPGNDAVGGYVFNREPIRLKIRAVSSAEGLIPKTNGTEKEYVLNYSIDSNQRVYPLQISNLKTNQKYAIWIGHEVVSKCYTSANCNTIGIAYDTNPYMFSTKLDPAKVATLNKNLSFQTKSSDVVLLKKYLSANGFMQNSTTSAFDIPTLVGVIKFQIANNLTTDGTIGSGSRSIINAWLLKQAQN